MAKKRWVRRILLLTATIMVVLLGGAMLAVMLAREQPAFYSIPALSAEERAQAARSAEEKIIRIQNQAARISAASRATNRAATGGPVLQSTANEPVTIVFTSAELNSFFDKWSNFQNWKGIYQNYFTDPAIFLSDGRLILAAKLNDLNLIVSLHFDAKINEKGQLDLQLARVLGGRLPLPEAMLGKYEQRVAAHVSRQIERWQSTAKIDSNGAANASAISASLGKMFAHMLRHEPAEPVLFLPVLGQSGSVPVKILDVKIDDGSIALTVRPMTRDEQTALLARIKESDAAVAEIESSQH